MDWINLFRLLFLFLFLAHGCISPEKNAKKEIEREVRNCLGKQVLFPDSVYLIKHGTIVSVESNILFNEWYKIITFISGDCEKCFENLKEWESYTESVRLIAEVNLIIVIVTTNMSAFEQTYLMKVPEKLTVIVDSDMDIFRINKLPYNWELRTFLLDQQNRILVVGNPVTNIRINQLYKTQIEKGSYHEK